MKTEYPKYKKEGIDCYYCLYFEKGKFKGDRVTTISDINDSLGLELKEGYSTYTIFNPDETIFHDTHVSVPIRNFYYLDAIMKYFYRRDNLIVTHQGKKLRNVEFEPYKYTFHKTIDLDQWRNARDEFKDKMNKKLSILVTFEFDNELAPMESEGSVNSLASWGKNTQLGEKIVTEGLKRYFHITHSYLTLGLKIKTILMVGEVEFDSQTKTKNTGIPGLGRNDWMKFLDDMHDLFKANPEIGDHVSLLNEYAASMKSLTNKELIRSKLFIEGETSGTSNHRLIPAKLRDALSDNRELCNLYVVEG